MVRLWVMLYSCFGFPNSLIFYITLIFGENRYIFRTTFWMIFAIAPLSYSKTLGFLYKENKMVGSTGEQ